MRSFCYECFRPTWLCLCTHVPRILNRTEIVVLQHESERFHPFGSVRLLTRALARSRVHVAYRGFGKDVPLSLRFPAGTALLYPRPDAVELSENQHEVERLVVLDGTWSQAHRLYRDNPWLRGLPHVRLTPSRASRYKVRREPKPHCLSTLEATVEALRVLEPGIRGLEELLAVFERMNIEQVRARGAVTRMPRKKRPRNRTPRAVSPLLRAWDDNLVVFYAESAELATRGDPRRKELFQCSAVRATTGELFHALVRPHRGAPTDTHLGRLRLERETLGQLVSEQQLVDQLHAFVRPTDVLLAWNQSTFNLLPESLSARHELLQLKASYCNARGGRCGALEDVIEREGLRVTPLAVPGRAGQRLANAWAAAAFLAHTFGTGG